MTETTDLDLEFLFDDQESGYTEPEFRILEEDGKWVVCRAISKPIASKVAAERWLNDMYPCCAACGSYKYGEDDPLECYQAGGWNVFMHVSCQEKLHKESEEEFYVSVINYVRGQPNNIRPGTIGACEADIAKKLVEEDPTLLEPENKDTLLRTIKSIYDDRAVRITPTPEDIPF
jgi:hypothetical protein